MTVNLRFEPEAIAELHAALRWYDLQRKGQGLSFHQEIRNTLARLCSYPNSGGLAPDVPEALDIRHLVVNRYPYSVIYLRQQGTIHILAIAHASRRPGYWLSRRFPL